MQVHPVDTPSGGSESYRFSVDEDPNTNDRLYLWDIVCRLPTNEECSPGRDRPMLPPKAVDDARPTLVLDLDETLVHSGFVDSRSDITLRFEYDGAECAIGVRFRPHLFPFLKFVSDRFEVVVFTAAEKPYAERVLDRLDPYGRFFSHRLYRDSCVAVGGKLFKDLSALGRDLARTAILDDSPISYGFQLDNAVPITPWRGGTDGRESPEPRRVSSGSGARRGPETPAREDVRAAGVRRATRGEDAVDGTKMKTNGSDDASRARRAASSVVRLLY